MIDRYAALVSQPKVGLSGNVFVSITLSRQEQADISAFEGAVQRVPEMMECARDASKCSWEPDGSSRRPYIHDEA